MKGNKLFRNEEKILIAAEKFAKINYNTAGRIYNNQDKQSFFEGVKFVLLRLEGGKEALESRGYNI